MLTNSVGWKFILEQQEWLMFALQCWDLSWEDFKADVIQQLGLNYLETFSLTYLVVGVGYELEPQLGWGSEHLHAPFSYSLSLWASGGFFAEWWWLCPRANIPKEQMSGSWHFYDVASKSVSFSPCVLLDTVQRHTNTGRERWTFPFNGKSIQVLRAVRNVIWLLPDCHYKEIMQAIFGK